MRGIPTDILFLRYNNSHTRPTQIEPFLQSSTESALSRPPLADAPPMRFGEWLVLRNLIDRQELYTALDVTFRFNCRLGDSLVWLDILGRQLVEREVSLFLAHMQRRKPPEGHRRKIQLQSFS
jgi:hypothetical protein